MLPVLLVVLPGFAQNEQDTTCVPTIQEWLLEMQRRQVFTLKIIALQYPYEAKTYFWHGIEVFAMGGKNSRFPFRFRTWYRAWQTMKRLHRQYKIQQVQSFWLTESALLAQKFAEYYKIPNVFCLHGQDAKLENRYLPLLNLKKYPIVAISSTLAQFFEQNTQVKPTLIQMGINVKTCDATDRPIDILGVGSLIPLKNYRLFLQLMAQLLPTFPHLQAEIIGEGPEMPILQADLEALQLQKNVRLCGRLSREMTLAKMENAKIFLHTSIYEGQGLVITEALAKGCYVVQFEVGELVHHEKVHICPDEAAMKAALTQILSLQKHDFQPFVAFDAKDTVQAFLDLYQANSSASFSAIMA
ncbi:MAG: glycosyltransferase family 4 protein [Bacteroidia bacterium]